MKKIIFYLLLLAVVFHPTMPLIAQEQSPKKESKPARKKEKTAKEQKKKKPREKPAEVSQQGEDPKKPGESSDPNQKPKSVYDEAADYNAKHAKDYPVTGDYAKQKKDLKKRNYEIVRDANTGNDIHDVKRVRYGDGVNLTVINFNKFKYDALMDYNIVQFDSKSQQNDLRSMFGMGDEKTDNTTTETKPAGTAPTTAESKEAARKNVVDQLQKEIDRMPAETKKNAQKIKDALTDPKASVSDALNQMKKVSGIQPFVLKIESIQDNFEKTSAAIDTKDIYEQLRQKEDDFYEKVAAIDATAKNYVWFTEYLNDVKTSSDDYIEIKSKASDKQKELELDFTNDFKTFSDQITELKSNYYDLLRFIASIPAAPAGKKGEYGYDLEKTKKGLEKNYDRIRKADYDKGIKAASALYNDVTNEDNYTIHFGKVTASGDELEFNFKQTPKAGAKNAFPSGFTKTVGVYNYWTFDVSTGLLGMATMKEKVFNRTDFDSVVGTTTKSFTRIAQRNKSSNINIGFAGFIHASYAFTPVVRWGISVGGGVSASSELNGAFFFGTNLGIRLGHKALMSIETGLSLAKTSVIKEKYRDAFQDPDAKGTQYAVFDKGYVEETYTENRVNPGFYFGVSFNLLSTKLTPKPKQ